ncbi:MULTISPECIES: anti-sigma factor family protein [Streptomycetaceae]|uniref:Putative zinc-finger domain-containing protein n=1 Tax=Streptantibioticus cattleyicolor (strain ATCC 35852 / DSM 46488 / JCM 4925 / NBRC 14057 / NRRL 8057) TaxID=1003195 RepID=F8K3N8_STREN|nr:zf-HC2 domain-containing protein [Streptantibioticus cattleyicolor]AEW96361.1 hypothetical protein SCATT_39900 [Streptantibioticus cattleyicolor NRRL 8057 = DSM 46488]MYS60875.1 hypothetical protein [Streptomyces sp. SID5468]CCB76701.1 conserved protein of unknown function [Streptantibioticus cattleyicolor NRRL 8057 = DSM 46488]
MKPAAASAAEEHLGDRLAAFVDGELADDTRERVLAHLATCEQCKAEADEQRRLKDAIAGATPPVLSAGLLARLQQLPGGGPDGPGGGPLDRIDGALFGGGLFGPADGHHGHGEAEVRGPEREPLLAPGRGSAAHPGRMDGFRIHEFSRPSRGRRFAFAAAGAFSMAALALGGALPLDAAIEGGTGPSDGGAGTSLTPIGASGAGGRPARPEPGLLSAQVGGAATPVSASWPLLLRPRPDAGVTRPVPVISGVPATPLAQAPSPLIGGAVPARGDTQR